MPKKQAKSYVIIRSKSIWPSQHSHALQKQESSEISSRQKPSRKRFRYIVYNSWMSGCWKINNCKIGIPIRYTTVRRGISPKFLSTCRSPGFVEYDSYSDAIQYGSIFQARHLKNLRREPSPPNCLLLHIDLKGVIEFLGYRSARKKLKNQIKKSTILPVPQMQMIDPMICDLMISGYLSNPMFKRFNKVLINTVHTSFKNNSRQLYARSSRKNLGFSKVDLARRFHKEAYNAWHRNLYKLHPVRVDSTHVDLSGNLVVNNQSICDNWKSRLNM